MPRQPVKAMVRDALLNGDQLTSLDAYHRFDCLHLASAIRRLRREGMAIRTELIETRNGDGRLVQYARYAITGNE